MRNMRKYVISKAYIIFIILRNTQVRFCGVPMAILVSVLERNSIPFVMAYNNLTRLWS